MRLALRDDDRVQGLGQPVRWLPMLSRRTKCSFGAKRGSAVVVGLAYIQDLLVRGLIPF